MNTVVRLWKACLLLRRVLSPIQNREPPALPPPYHADLAEDTCYVEGIVGVSDDGVHCCPLGCGQCGGGGCGAIPEVNIFPDGRDLPDNATAWSYCCLGAFAEIEVQCGDPGVEPPCIIPEGLL